VVCSPTLLAGARRLRTPQDLLRFPLLASHAKMPFEWRAWATRFGVDLKHAQTVHLHDYNIVVEAALAGQGIAMGRHRLIAAQLASGALVRPAPDAVLDDPRIGWWLVTPRRGESEAAGAFRDWLMQMAAQDPLD
jgi:LysR family transcriptional regulator, glycine cleavage system transcriptional activator